MPTYIYACSNKECNHKQDHIHKMSDPNIKVCPKCEKETYGKTVLTADETMGFSLKGVGNYKSGGFK